MKMLGAMLVAFAVASSSAAAQPPEQFRVWGSRAAAHTQFRLMDEAESPPEAVQVSPDIEARGFHVVGVSPAAPLSVFHLPVGDGGPAPLAVADCPGQYGPIALGLMPFADSPVAVAVTDLAGPGGATIGRENFDVRRMRTAAVQVKGKAELVPFVLEKPDSRPLAARRTYAWWITYHVPDDAAPGAYAGAITVSAGGAQRLRIPLRLTVHPFRLAAPGVNLYIYFNNSTEARDMPLVGMQLADQRCHGMTIAPLVLPIARDGTMTREAVAPWLDVYARAGLPGKHLHVGLWNRITSEWLNTPDASIKMWGPWFRYYPFTDALDRRYAQTVKMLRDEAHARGLDLVLAVADEAGSHPWTTEATQHYCALVKREAPDVIRELTVGGGWAMKRPEHDLWRGLINIWTTNRWLPEQLDLVRRGDPAAVIQVYNMGGDGSGPGGVESVRALYGFFLWKTGAAGAAQWTYHHGATPLNNYTWPSAEPGEGHVPTVRWEMVREGAKDRRYIATLEARLAGRTGPAADEARAFLDEIRGRIELATDQYDPIGGGRIKVQPPGTYDAWRGRLAELITRLGS